MAHDLTTEISSAIVVKTGYTLGHLASGIHEETPITNISGAVGTLDFAGRATLIHTVTGSLSGSYTFPPVNVPAMPVNSTRTWLFIEYIQDGTGGRAIPLDTLFANATTRRGNSSVDTAPGGRTRVKILMQRVGGTIQYHAEFIPQHVHDNLSVSTTNSLTGGGNLGTSRTLQLVGDQASPGNHAFYKTNASGVRGWATAALGDLNNVVLTSPASGQHLTYNGTNWINTTVSAGGGSVSGGITVATINDLKGLTPSSDPVYVRGYATAGDGGQGFFVWNSLDARTMVTAAAINAAGSGYYAGSEVWVSGASTLGSPARYQIATVDGAGAVTELRLLSKGAYTTNPTTSGVSTVVMGTGTGLTLNLTMGPLDDGATVVPLTAGGTGRWLRQFSGAVNICWFGAKPDGTTDNIVAIQAAIACQSQFDSVMSQWAYGPVYVPPGRFAVGTSIVLLPGSKLFGYSYRTSIIHALSMTTPIIATNVKTTATQRNASDWTKRKRVHIEGLMLTGTCEHAIQMIYNTESSLRDVYCRATSSSHQIYLADCWDFDLINVKTIGANVNADSACLYVGRDMNAFTCMKLETSSANKFGIYHFGEVSGTGVAGHVVNYIDCALQGHTDTAVYVASNGYGGMIIQNLYTEGCRQAISLGEETTSRSCRGVSIVGGLLQGSTGKIGKAVICIWRAEGVSITGCTCVRGDNAAILGLGMVKRLSVVGASAGFSTNWLWGPSTQTVADSKIQHLATNSTGNTRKVQGLLILDDWGTANEPTGGGQLIMSGRSPSGNTSRRITRMYINDDTDPPTMVLEKITLPAIAYDFGGTLPP